MNKITLPNDILLGEVAAVLHEGRDAVITPTGNSMLPFIRGGVDRVVLRREPDVAVGDIILMHADGRYILHRVIAVDGDTVTLMGDGNIRGTEHCRRDEVLGTPRPQGGSRRPGKPRLWHSLRPIRRYLLFAYRRLFLR